MHSNGAVNECTRQALAPLAVCVCVFLLTFSWGGRKGTASTTHFRETEGDRGAMREEDKAKHSQEGLVVCGEMAMRWGCHDVAA